MKNYILFVLFSVILIVSLASATQPPKLQWVARYKGPGSNYGYPLALAIDVSGNVYVTGASEAQSDFPRASGTPYRDYATVKYDSNGTQLWVARYNGPANSEDSARAIAVDNSGNVYVTGGSRTNLEDETWRGLDCATIKYNSEGKQLWVARDGTNGGSAIALDNSGNIYVTGDGSADRNKPKYTTIKYDSNGKKLWVRHRNYRRGIYTIPTGIALDDSGNVYVNGLHPVKYKPNGDQVWAKSFGEFLRLEDTNSFYYIRSIHNSITSLDSELFKHDQNGKKLWSARYNGPANAYDSLEYLGADRFGNVYLAGNSDGKGTELDYVTIKYGCNGNKLWLARYNGPANGRDIAGGMVVDDSGNVYLTGSSERFANSDETDVVTLKYDSNGKELWCVRYGGNFGSVRALAIDDSGNVYVTGDGSYRGGEYVTLKYAQHD